MSDKDHPYIDNHSPSDRQAATFHVADLTNPFFSPGAEN